jgi:hypothetical protein
LDRHTRDRSDTELDLREAPGEWSPREVIHHLADSEMTSAMRLRALLAEDRPALRGYDQDEYARMLFYDRPIEHSLAAFRAARDSTAEILDRMSDEQWQREGTHSESGRYAVTDLLRIYAPTSTPTRSAGRWRRGDRDEGIGMRG